MGAEEAERRLKAMMGTERTQKKNEDVDVDKVQ